MLYDGINVIRWKKSSKYVFYTTGVHSFQSVLVLWHGVQAGSQCLLGFTKMQIKHRKNTSGAVCSRVVVQFNKYRSTALYLIQWTRYCLMQNDSYSTCDTAVIGEFAGHISVAGELCDDKYCK